MNHQNSRRPPSLDLISLSTPAEDLDEKAPTDQPDSSRRSPCSPRPIQHSASLPRSQFTPATPSSSHPGSYFPSQPPRKSTITYIRPTLAQAPTRSSLSNSSSFTRTHKGPRIVRLLKPWIPMFMYALSSFAFVVAIALYRTELFTRLDELSLWLRSDEQYGYAILFFLIFLTTIPPIPLYSTLIILSGYTFGPWTGAIISYFAALLGALFVFIVSRSLFSESIGQWLASYRSIRRVVRAIEKKPKLLFLIRLAPYPYNVMNCLLAASPTLTLHTYTVCTALSLFKVIIHTSMGASIHSFKDFHLVESDQTDNESSTDMIARIWTIIGIALCILILVYLSIVARRAVDEELDDEPITSHNSEETVGFLSSSSPPSLEDIESGVPLSRDRPMTEIPFRTPQLVPYRPSFSVEPDANAHSWS